MNRRGFLSGMLALGAAPAIVRADSLMRIVPVETSIITMGVDLAKNAGDIVILRIWNEVYPSMADPLGQRPWAEDRRMTVEQFQREFPGHNLSAKSNKSKHQEPIDVFYWDQKAVR